MPGALEHATWESGESIDWPEGAFALETATGRVQGYRLGPWYTNDWWHEAVDYQIFSRSWVGARITERQRADMPPAYARWSYVLLDRESLQSWRWPGDELQLEAVSKDHILLRDGDGLFTLMTRSGDVRTHFSLSGAAHDLSYSQYPNAYSFFSPDGEALVIGADSVYWMPLAASRPQVLFEPEPREGWREWGMEVGYSGVPLESRPEPWWGVRHDLPRSIRVDVYYRRIAETDDEETPLTIEMETHFFGWDGERRPSPPVPVCPGHVSPDGRYVAEQRGFAFGHKYHGNLPEDTGPWPIVVIRDTGSCEPLFRVLSAYTYQGLWQAEWLSDSAGYVLGLKESFAVVPVDPERGLTYLPAAPNWLGQVPGPVPAPEGGGRYFSYAFHGVYDAAEGELKRVDFVSEHPDSGVPWEFTSWGSTHEEVHYQTGRWGPLSWWDGAFGGAVQWHLLQPKVEFPPFPDELSFIVAGTGDCLDLFESVEFGTEAVSCLPDGTRVSLVRSAHHPHVHLSSRPHATGDRSAHVRTEDGLEGWVSIEYLRHE